MTNDEYQIEKDPIVIALTRPPIFMGVNIRLFFANVMLCTLICIDAHTLLGIPLFLLLHVCMVKLSIKEPNFHVIVFKSFTKTPPVLNKKFWGCTNSYASW